VVCRNPLVNSLDLVTYRGLAHYQRAVMNADAVVHVRDYWRRAERVPNSQLRHILWSQDTIKEALSLGPGRQIEDLRQHMRSFDLHILPSHWLQSEFRSADLIDSKSVVIHQPVPSPPPRELERHRLIVHTAHPRKCLPLVLRAWRRLRHLLPEWRILILGGPEIYQEINFMHCGLTMSVRQLVTDILGSNEPSVQVMPPVSQEVVLSVLRRSEILLHPDLSIETGATTVLEGMASGAVPVVSDHGCLPELCEGRGLICTSRGSGFLSSVCTAVLSLATNLPLREQLRSSCKEFSSTYAPASVAGSWIAAASSLLPLNAFRVKS
jgi:glycosyltransferase involved in cell wall biosynthesis